MPLSIRRAKARTAALLDALEVGETWDAHDAERAFNFERRWAAQVAGAPRGLRAQLLDLARQARDTSPTFARLYRSMDYHGLFEARRRHRRTQRIDRPRKDAVETRL